METDGGVRYFPVLTFFSPSQARSDSQTSWARMPMEPKKLGLLCHSRFRVVFFIVSVCSCV